MNIRLKLLGGEMLYGDKDDEEDYIIALKKPSEVLDIYNFLANISESQFRELYFKIDKDKYGFDVDEQDFGYTWGWLTGTIEFWKVAAERKQFVAFSVDQ